MALKNGFHMQGAVQALVPFASSQAVLLADLSCSFVKAYLACSKIILRPEPDCNQLSAFVQDLDIG